MSIYDYNIVAATLDLMPPNKRKPVNLALVGVPGSLLQYQHDLFFNDYADGFTGNKWNVGSTYIKGDSFWYTDNCVYECTVNAVAGTLPSDTNFFIKILNNRIGVRERLRYNSQKIILELILNKYFDVGSTAFPFTGADHSTQIFISKNTANNHTAWMSATTQANDSFFMASDSKYSNSWMPQSPLASQPYSFTINVPTAVVAAIQATIPAGSSSTGKDLIRSIADRYVRAGKIYTIDQY